MYHVSNLGSFGGEARRYADIDGYVPEQGDRHEDMAWDAMTEWDDESWSDWVDEAEAATQRANEAAAQWQAENPAAGPVTG